MLILIVGLPNSGKTTYSQQFHDVIHLDDVGSMREICRMVSTDRDVVIEGFIGLPRHRREILNEYKGDYRKCIFLDMTFEESVRRENRGRAEFVLKNASVFFTPPTYDEGWDAIIRIKQGEETCK